MRNRVVMYSVGAIVVMSLIAAAAFKSRRPASSSVALALPAAPSSSVAKHAPAKVVHSVVKLAVAPSVTDSVAPLPANYRVLLTHCLFSSHPTRSSIKSASPADGELTLRGVYQSGRRCVAYIENTASHQSQELHVGDPVGLGKLIAIDFDGVRYAAPGRNMRVEVGQSFNGARTVATAQTSALSTLRQITE